MIELVGPPKPIEYEAHFRHILPARFTVWRSKVVKATPALEWAVGKSLHDVLSWCVRRGVLWNQRQAARQMEPAL